MRGQNQKRAIRLAAFALLLLSSVRGLPLAGGLLAQESTDSTWKSDLKESDLDANGFRELLLRKASLPKKIRLRYSRTYLNYAIFYDLRGREIYFRYREHRFDYRAERKLRGLIAGQAYELSVEVEGLVANHRSYKAADEEFYDILRNKDNVLVFRFIDAYPLRTEQILF